MTKVDEALVERVADIMRPHLPIIRTDLLYNAVRAALEVLPPEKRVTNGVTYTIEHDGFVGTHQGSYITREGKCGVVLQQVDTRVVHVYGEKWLKEGKS